MRDDLFEEIADILVGEKVVFTISEWHDAYNTHPRSLLYTWTQRGRKLEDRKFSTKTLGKEYLILRTK